MSAVRSLTVAVLFAGAIALAGCSEKKPERNFNENPNPAPPVGPVGGDPNAPGKGGAGDADTANRAEAVERLKVIGIAMHQVETAFQHFPAGLAGPKGAVGLSWRVQILPYVGEEKLYKEFKLDEAWDSDHNKKLIAKMPKVFASPGKDSGEGKTHLRSFVGETAFIQAPLPQSPNLKPGFPLRGRRVSDITDGTSNTLVVAEAPDAVEWTKPDELPFRGQPGAKPPAAPKLGGVFAGGFHAVTCDGAARFFPAAKFTDAVVAPMITVQGGEVLPGEVSEFLFPPKPKKSLPPATVPADLPDAAARTAAVANYLAVVKGAHAFHDIHGYLPAGTTSGGTVGLSWRVQILPYVGEEKLHKEFKLAEPWDSEHNKKLIERMPKVFESPGKATERGYTFLRTTQGPGGILRTPPPGSKSGPPTGAKGGDPPTGAKGGGPLAGRPLHAIPDGASNTIWLVEASEAGPWTKPDELTIANMPNDPFTKGGVKEPKEPRLPKLGGVFADGFHAVMADARVTFYKSDYPVQELAKLFCPNDGLLIEPLAESDKILYSIPFVPAKVVPVPPPPK